MRKHLLATAAFSVLALAAPCAHAADEGGVDLGLSGYFAGYVGYLDQQESLGGMEVRSVDWLQDTEVQFVGESALDNDLTVGAYFAMDSDRNAGTISDSFLYFQGDWGRVNLGSTDGAAFLLQVAAPSADENYDGVQPTINPFNGSPLVVSNAADYNASAPEFSSALALHGGYLGYDQSPSGSAEKITYFTPVFSGFQAGLSYAPDVEPDSDTTAGSGFGFNTDNVADTYGSLYEAAVRYEGKFDEVEVKVGGGYSFIEAEKEGLVITDDLTEWNAGLDLNFRAFGLGAAYKDSNTEWANVDAGEETWVVGADYTKGPFRFGASYLHQDTDWTRDYSLEADRTTGGVVYEYGPGMTFRGSVSYTYYDVPQGQRDIDATSVLLGTQVNF